MVCSITGWLNHWIIVLLVVEVTAEGYRITVDSFKGVDDLSCYNGTGKACKTLNYTLTNGLRSNIIMDIAEGVYSLKLQNVSFYNFSNVLIHGAGHKATIIKCHFGVGLKFQNSTQVKLANLSLIRGGQLSNSTSVNRTNNEVALFRASLYFLNCIDVALNSIVVTNSTGTGVALYDVTGSVSITNSIFSFNKVPTNDTEHLPSGGGLYVEFSRLTINKNSDTVDAWYKIHHCSFNGNNAVAVENVDISHIRLDNTLVVTFDSLVMVVACLLT